MALFYPHQKHRYIKNTETLMDKKQTFMVIFQGLLNLHGIMNPPWLQSEFTALVPANPRELSMIFPSQKRHCWGNFSLKFMELIQYGMMDTTPTALKVISRVKGRDSDGIWWNTWQKPSQLTDILGLKPSQIPKCSRATPVRFSAASVSLLCPDLCPLTAQFW